MPRVIFANVVAETGAEPVEDPFKNTFAFTVSSTMLAMLVTFGEAVKDDDDRVPEKNITLLDVEKAPEIYNKRSPALALLA